MNDLRAAVKGIFYTKVGFSKEVGDQTFVKGFLLQKPIVILFSFAMKSLTNPKDFDNIIVLE